jgi:hypothetical protein
LLLSINKETKTFLLLFSVSRLLLKMNENREREIERERERERGEIREQEERFS